MRQEIEKKLNTIKKASRVLRAISIGLLVLIAFIGIACTVCVAFGVGGINYNQVIFGTEGLTLSHRLGLGLVTALTWCVLFKCFYHLFRLSGFYSRTEIFTRDSVGQIRQFGITCVLWSVVNFVWISSLALSSHTPKTFQGHADSMIIGATIIVIAWFMDMAVDLREENELTI